MAVVHIFAKKDKDIQSLKKLYTYEIKTGKVLIGPIAIIAFASGWILTEAYGFGWPFWATWGGIIAIVVMILGGAVEQKLRKRLIQLIEKKEEKTVGFIKMQKRLEAIELVSTFLLIGAVWLMVFKYSV